MKKALSLILVLVMCLSMCACASNVGTDDTANSNPTSNNNHPQATIINNDGKTESLTAGELYELMSANEVAFNKKYLGAQVTLIAKVTSIHGNAILDSHIVAAYITLEDGWRVEASSGKVVENLMPGDYVKVTGTIYSLWGYINLYISNGSETTIQPCSNESK